MTAVRDMSGLLRHELGDLLYAEKVFLKGLKQMSKETSIEQLRDRIVQHAEETQEQIVNLERAFECLGHKAKAEKCAGSLGMDEERQAFREEKLPGPLLLEAFNLGAGLRVEHYEIAGYRSAIALARQAGSQECVGLLKANLDQEVAMAAFLEQSAPGALAQLEVRLGNTGNGTDQRFV